MGIDDFDDGVPTRHPAYGAISLSRVSSGPPGKRLFMSDVYHQNFFVIEISEADYNRSLSDSSHYAHKSLIRVALSANQLLDFFSSQNMGGGVPCTLERVRDAEGKFRMVEDPPFSDKLDTFKEEMKEDIRETRNTLNALLKEVQTLRDEKKKAGAKDLDNLIDKIELARAKVCSNLPFVQKMAIERFEKRKQEAKAEVEALFSSSLQNIALRAVGENPELLREEVEGKILGEKDLALPEAEEGDV